jgi:hypothetical protein
MGREDINKALAGIRDAEEMTMEPLTDDQRREVDEIVMMVTKISDLGYRLDYSFRGYDNKHYVILEGTKCYGQAPKVHAFLSGAYAIMDWSRKKELDA